MFVNMLGFLDKILESKFRSSCLWFKHYILGYLSNHHFFSLKFCFSVIQYISAAVSHPPLYSFPHQLSSSHKDCTSISLHKESGLKETTTKQDKRKYNKRQRTSSNSDAKLDNSVRGKMSQKHAKESDTHLFPLLGLPQS